MPRPNIGATVAPPAPQPDPLAEVRRLRGIAETAQTLEVRRSYTELANQREAEIRAASIGPTLEKRYRGYRDTKTGTLIAFDVDKDSPSSLVSKAAQFRHIADTTSDPGTRESYTALARELEAAANPQGAA